MNDKRPYIGIICHKHGKIDLTKAQHDRQLRRHNMRWHCPKCGLLASFDKQRSEQLKGNQNG